MNKFDTIIETDRLILRPFTMSDVEPSYQMNLDPRMTRYTNDGGVKSREQMHDTIKNNVLGDYAKYGFGRFAVDLKEENAFIGFSGLKYLPEEDQVDLGYRFRPDLWGRGIATESAIASLEFARNTLKLEQVVACILPDNKASHRILEKLGFIFSKEYVCEDELIHEFSLDL